MARSSGSGFASARRVRRPRSTRAAVVRRSGRTAVGTTPTDETVDIYLAALRHSVVAPDDLEAVGFSADDIRTALDQFTRRGLVSPMGEGRWQIIPPDIALTALAARLEERARSLRSSAPGLARLHAEGMSKQNLPLAGATTLTSIAAVQSAVHQLITGAKTSVHMMHSDSPYLRTLLEVPMDRQTRPIRGGLGQPLRAQITFDSSLLHHTGLVAVLGRRAEAGDQQRFTRSVPFSAYANDSGMAVLDLEDEHGSPIGLALTEPAGSQAIRRMIQWAWQLGVPWQPGDPLAVGQDHFDKRDREILRLLAIGSSDSIVARQLGISQRTVERRVRVILDRLNAVNRFQAGVLAAERGLI